MAQEFTINGVTVSRIVKGDWVDEPGDAQSLAGVTPLARWRRHRWQADVLTAAEWDVLDGLQGQKVGITTPDYSDRNAADYVQYWGCDFEGLSGSHDGPVFLNVSCDFMVRV